jgi:hypothetical protein
MTYYSLIINAHGKDVYETVSLSGMHSLAAAAGYLDHLAKAGEIPSVTEVNVYDVVKISKSQLQGLFQALEIDPSILEDGDFFDVDLFEF